VERWFKKLTDQRLRRGTFISIAELTEAITAWTDHGNTSPIPFAWHAAAADIIEKVRRGRSTLSQLNPVAEQ
jgi:hypothetical protein